MNSEQPELPYGTDEPSSGFSGSETSEARARDADASGLTARRQVAAMAALDEAGAMGLTWRELADELGLHHGSASSVLSVLHKTGRISRLTWARLRCKVYVLPEHVNERATEPHGRTAATGLLEQAIFVLRSLGPCPYHRIADPRAGCLGCQGSAVVAEYDQKNNPTRRE